VYKRTIMCKSQGIEQYIYASTKSLEV